MNENNANVSSILEELDLYSMLRDAVRNLWVIILGAIAVAMIVSMSVRADFRSTYSTTATFVVTSKTSSNHAYSNLSAASSMANSFTNILNSNLLKKKVCQDLGLSSFNATASARVINGTNLMTLRVTSDSPRNAYQIIRSIMKTVSSLTPYVSGDMIMEVLQEPAVPLGADASFSARNQSLRAFLITALLLTLAFMYLSYCKETIKGEKDLGQKLDAKSLGMLYYDPTYSSLGNFFLRKKNKHLVTDLYGKFEYVERFKKIATHISTEAHKNDAKVILVTSVREHEGKSTVSANLALTLEQQSYRILLIDGDMRRPTLHKLLLDQKDKPQATLASLLAGTATMNEALFRYKDQNLFMLLNNRNYPNSTDIVSSNEMEKLIAAARKYFDYIIIDSPPMSLMADAEVMANLADMSVLVVAYDSVLAQDLNDAIDSLRDCKAYFAGCILSQVRTLPGTRRVVGGYGGYGRYGHYGRYGRYGRYGNYGAYGRYGEGSDSAKKTS